MTPEVAQFADTMTASAKALGDVSNIEWRISADPVPYPQAVTEMEQRVADIAAGSACETVWFLEHPSLYTAGTSAQPADLLDRDRFPVYETGRGGQYTYHGPGQLVAYVMVDLNIRGRDVRRFIQSLEAWVIAALRDYGVKGEHRDGLPGVWVGQQPQKIAAVGVRVRRWVTFHGFAVNVCPDLTHFSSIAPCGIVDASLTSLKALNAIQALCGG